MGIGQTPLRSNTGHILNCLRPKEFLQESSAEAPNQSSMSHCTSSHESADMLLLLLLSAWLSVALPAIVDGIGAAGGPGGLSVACPGGIVDGIGSAGGPGGGPGTGEAAGGPGGPEGGPGGLLTVTGIITMRSRCVHHGRWQPPSSNGRHMTGYRSPVTCRGSIDTRTGHQREYSC